MGPHYLRKESHRTNTNSLKGKASIKKDSFKMYLLFSLVFSYSFSSLSLFQKLCDTELCITDWYYYVLCNILCVSEGEGDSFQLCDLEVIKLSVGKYRVVFPLLCFVVLAVIGRLCFVGYYRKCPLIKKTDGLLVDSLIRAGKIVFAEFVLLRKILSDTDKNFISDKFRQFCKN